MKYTELPEGYSHLKTMGLSDTRKEYWLVNGLSIAVGALMVVVGWLICPLNKELTGVDLMSLIPVAVALVGYALYLVIRETVHSISILYYSRTKPKFGFKKVYAYAGSKVFFDKKKIVALKIVPDVVWTVVLAILNVVFHSGMWFWVVWFIQIANVISTAGDIYFCCKIGKLPGDVLMQDMGARMELYVRVPAGEQEEETEKTTEEIAEKTEEADD